MTVHVEQAVSELVPEQEQGGTGAQQPPQRDDAVRAELERLRRDALRTASEAYGD